jgi:protein-L-isoaspartate(D-aspartate) O-methyltransferase
MRIARNEARLVHQIGISLLASAILASCRGIQPPLQVATPPNGSSPALEASRSPEVIDSFEKARLALVRNSIEARGVDDPEVLRAMRAVPRHEFVPSQYVGQAYNDHPLPIGYGQTISQPYIVAWMTELLELQPGEKVLEIGTGSGYQAAILAELGFVEVYSIEIVPELAVQATDLLRELGFEEIHVRQGDGYYGWPEAAPFDAIIVTAAPDHLPAPLADQLAEGGRLVIPIGPRGLYQSLWQFVKEQGELTAYDMGGVRFVPFTGQGVDEAPQETLP